MRSTWLAVPALGLALLACGGGGDDGGNTGDASGSGSGADAQTMGTATLHVRDAVSPAPAAVIVQHRADGTFVQQLTADAAGEASLDVHAGDAISVITNSSLPTITASPLVRTIAGVQPGDELVFGTAPHTPVTHAITITVPTATPASTTNIEIRTPCGSGGGNGLTFELTLIDCGAQADVFVIARNDDVLLGTLYAPAQDVSGATLALGGSYVPGRNVSVSLANLSPAITTQQAIVALNADRFELFRDATTLTTTGTTASGSVLVPDVPGTELVARYPLTRPGFGLQLVTKRIENGPSITVDAAVDLTAWVSDAPAFDLDTSTLVWTDVGTPNSEFVFARVGFGGLALGDAPPPFRWEIFAPYRTGALVLPTMPADLTQVHPSPLGSAQIVQFAHGRDPADGAALRAQVFEQDRRAAGDGPTGTGVISGFFAP